MSCTLTLTAKEFDIDTVLTALQLKPHSTWRQGELISPTTKKPPLPHSGILFIASNADFNSFKQQVVDVVAFIKEHHQDLTILRDFAVRLPEADFHFDFGLYTRMFDVVAQVDFLPAELIKLCAEIGAGIMFSQYPPPDEEQDDKD